MPFVGGREDDDEYDGGLFPGRKRRWDGVDGSRIFRLYSPEKQADLYPEGAGPRKILPISKRARIAAATEDDDDGNQALAESELSSDNRRCSQQQAKPSQDSAARPTCLRTSSALLTPCHICHRRPTKKSDLDSFAGCEGCGRRTCYVCIRECHGWPADQVEALLLEQAMLEQSFRMDGVQQSSPPQSQPLQPPLTPPPPPLNQTSTTAAAAPHSPLSPPPPAASEPNDGRDDRGQHRHARVGQNDDYKAGWDACGHRSVVCSRCCVEKGRQGEVVCLGCLSGLPGT